MKALIWGFVFGIVGMYVLAMLSLIFAPIEAASGFLFAPGRYLSERFAGPGASNSEVVLLTLANGIFYAIIFYLISKLWRK